MLAKTTAPTKSPSRNSPTMSRATIMTSRMTLKKESALERTTSQSLRWPVVSTLASPAARRRAASVAVSPAPGPSLTPATALVMA